MSAHPFQSFMDQTLRECAYGLAGRATNKLCMVLRRGSIACCYRTFSIHMLWFVAWNAETRATNWVSQSSPLTFEFWRDGNVCKTQNDQFDQDRSRWFLSWTGVYEKRRQKEWWQAIIWRTGPIKGTLFAFSNSNEGTQHTFVIHFQMLSVYSRFTFSGSSNFSWFLLHNGSLWRNCFVQLKERFSKPNIRFGSERNGPKIVSKIRLTRNRKLCSANRNTIVHMVAHGHWAPLL